MSQQIFEQLKEKYPTLEPEYYPRKGKITVYGFHTIAKENVAAVRAELESMGFVLGPNSGSLAVEQILEPVNFPVLTDEQKKATQEYWSR